MVRSKALAIAYLNAHVVLSCPGRTAKKTACNSKDLTVLKPFLTDRTGSSHYGARRRCAGVGDGNRARVSQYSEAGWTLLNRSRDETTNKFPQTMPGRVDFGTTGYSTGYSTVIRCRKSVSQKRPRYAKPLKKTLVYPVENPVETGLLSLLCVVRKETKGHQCLRRSSAET